MQGKNKHDIAAAAQDVLAWTFAELACSQARDAGVGTVGFSGGVAVNAAICAAIEKVVTGNKLKFVDEPQAALRRWRRLAGAGSSGSQGIEIRRGRLSTHTRARGRHAGVPLLTTGDNGTTDLVIDGLVDWQLLFAAFVDDVLAGHGFRRLCRSIRRAG